MDGSTVTGEREEDASRASQRRSALVVLCNADDPTRASSSHSLDEIDTVAFRRGERGSVREGRTLVLSIPDDRMSREHGRLLREADRWLLDDPSSKNPSIVDGTLTRHAHLHDGALVELGRTFLLFRDHVCDAVPAHLAADVDAAQLPAWHGLATFAPALARDLAASMRLANSAVSIMLLGETGTGKEVTARAIHASSGRRGDLVAINCGALPQTLIEAELFGYKRGAFSGAAVERRGLVRSADGGTLFLDEIGDLPRASQAALLRVIQEREVLPIGDDRPVAVDVRFVSATLRALDGSADFRSDLYARLAGHVVTLPPLRERREDLGLLLAALLPRIAGARAVRFAPNALRALLRYRWPLNVRELEQALTTAIALSPDGTIELEHLPAAVRDARPASAPQPTTDVLDDEDRELRARLEALLREHTGNVLAVANALGKRRSQIYKWVHRLGIDLDRFRAP